MKSRKLISGFLIVIIIQNFIGQDCAYSLEKSVGYFISEDEFIEVNENFDDDDRNFIELPKDFVIEMPDWKDEEVEDSNISENIKK